ncbi:MAG: 3-deoxy-D-manno-octulosonic acid transferase [Candidatus Hydrogenedentes bacterium]|nr:3-deoxy-D-manno-octulosonic acid transferase [Candidatus Hydrogenedentota bacterium]
MMLYLYKIAVTLATPLVALWLAMSARRRPLLARFRPPVFNFDAPPIWVHACSVGEVNTARPILEAMARRWPESPFLLTVSTPTAMALAQDLQLPAQVAWFPFDNPFLVGIFLRRLRPKALVLIETELWPCVITQTRATGAPVILVNGRLSDTRAASYRRFAAFFRPAIRCITSAGMQNERYAERLQALGADPARVTVTGNSKFDSAPARLSGEERARLRTALRIPPEAPVLVFGSTRPGDEALAAQCWESLKDRLPGLVLIVAPRHLERLSEAREAFRGSAVLLRSQLDAAAGSMSHGGVVLLDTHGELSCIYAIATVAIIGGSFYPGIDGHNPIEPAAQGVPTVFGPYMRNFPEAADALLAQNGAVQSTSADTLCSVLESLLDDSGARTRLGENASRTVLENRGATERTLELIEKAIG